MAKDQNGLIAVDLRGHKTQDDFEYEEIFNFFVLGKDQSERSSNTQNNQKKDRGDSAIVGEIGD
jgi:hypothetical protein